MKNKIPIYAYAAGVIDGEGSIDLNSYIKGVRLQISVGNTDPRMCMWMRDHFGGNVHITQQRPNKKIFYRWILPAANAADFLKIIYPYLVIKKEEADIALAYIRTKPGKGEKLYPHEKENNKQLVAKLKAIRGGKQ